MSRLNELQLKLAEAYRSEAPQLELARIEKSVWELASKQMLSGTRPRMRKTEFFRGIGGEAGAKSEHRSVILRAGEGAEALWDAVKDKRLSIRAAASVLRDAKRSSRSSQRPLAECLAEQLKLSAATGAMRVSRNGPPWAQQILDDIGQIAQAYIDRELPGTEPWEKRVIVKELIDDVRSMMQTFSAKVRVRRKAILMPKPHELRRACEWLKIPVPNNDAPLDYQATRKQYRLLLAQHHPDRNKSARSVEIYRAICEAMETIERLRAATGRIEK